MNAFIIYIIQSAASLIVLYLVYWLFLRRDTFFMVNRCYLLCSIIFSFFIPMLKIPVLYQESNAAYLILLETITITSEGIEQSVMGNSSIYETLVIVYLAGSGVFLMRFLFQLVQLALLIRRFWVHKKDGLNVVYLNKEYSTFSYFNYLFINKEIVKKENFKKIIEHEKIHIAQRHTIDLILVEILTIVQWLNPFIWFYKNSLKGIHEYLADEGVITGGSCKISYQNLLLNQMVGIQVNGLTNNFNQSLIKRRFIMMTKTQSKRRAGFKVFLAIPVLAVLVFLVSFYSVKNVNGQDVIEKKNLKQLEQDEVFRIVQERPRFVGGEKALMKYLRTNIKYPKDALSQGKAGKVFVRFIIEKDGSITDVKILRGICESMDKEALRVVKGMPNWIPGKQRGQSVRVVFNLPIAFKLDDKKQDPALPLPPKK